MTGRNPPFNALGPAIGLWPATAFTVPRPHDRDVTPTDGTSAPTPATKGLVCDVPVRAPRALNRLTEWP